jgi:uncharacterized repeat protein (TIGR03837 family)
MTWDIFCTVIDNFGDIGVTWRLARQLAAEHGVAVRLWVDDLAAFRRIWPAVDPALSVQWVGTEPSPEIVGYGKSRDALSGAAAHPSPASGGGAGGEGGSGYVGKISARSLFAEGEVPQAGMVKIRRWTTPLPDVKPGEVVIEALACNLPDAFVERMAACSPKPVWINLEYLTAEDWARGVHGLPSPHPRLPLTKYFFMPGYGPDTGGLTREAGLGRRRDAFQADPAARAAFWAELGVPAAAPGELRVSLFSYDNAALPGLLAAWAGGGAPVRVGVPEGKALPGIAAWFGLAEVPGPGATLRRGDLTLHVLPMLDQDRYDRLLWACDLNFVRGEDSFVRAQFAARPLVWQAYRQAEAAHLDKLDAFLNLYCATMAPDFAGLTRQVWHAWNRETSLGEAWPAWRAALPALAKHAQVWWEHLAAQPDTASNLLIFCKKKLE